MRLALVTIALFAASASASTRLTKSSCLNSCIHFTNSPRCKNGDVRCLCGDDYFSACVGRVCKDEAYTAAVKDARQLCANLPLDPGPTPGTPKPTPKSPPTTVGS